MESDDGWDYNIEVDEEEKTPALTKATSYVINSDASQFSTRFGTLTRADVLTEINSCILELVQSIFVSETVAHSLLTKLDWNVAQTRDVYFEDPEILQKLFKFDSLSAKPEWPADGVCEMCYEIANGWESISDCGHVICMECFETHLEMSVK
jgi:hypothetical protein